MVHVTDLKQGDQLVCYMRVGLAVYRQVNQHTKEVYRQVPHKGRKARNDDLTRFFGLVVANDVSQKILTLVITPFNSNLQSLGTPGEPVQIHYTAFSKINLLSNVSYSARQPNQKRPTSLSPLGYMNFKAYKTLVAVSLNDNT